MSARTKGGSLSAGYEVLCALRYGRLDMIRRDVLTSAIADGLVVTNAAPGVSALTELGQCVYKARLLGTLVRCDDE